MHRLGWTLLHSLWLLALLGILSIVAMILLKKKSAQTRYACGYLVQTCIETLLFFYPAVWWVSRSIRIERENCCDDLAVQNCGQGSELASALVAVEEGRCGAAAESSPRRHGWRHQRTGAPSARDSQSSGPHWILRAQHPVWSELAHLDRHFPRRAECHEGSNHSTRERFFGEPQ